MSVYEDPNQVAGLLRSAIASAGVGADGVRIGTVLLEAAADLLEQAANRPTVVLGVALDAAKEGDNVRVKLEGDGRTGLGIDKHRFIFHKWQKRLTVCDTCRGAVPEDNIEGHAQWHVDIGQFPKVTSLSYNH